MPGDIKIDQTGVEIEGVLRSAESNGNLYVESPLYADSINIKYLYSHAPDVKIRLHGGLIIAPQMIQSPIPLKIQEYAQISYSSLIFHEFDRLVPSIDPKTGTQIMKPIYKDIDLLDEIKKLRSELDEIKARLNHP